MTREDYEEQKRRLAEQRRVLVELAENAYQYQVRALDIVWRMLSGEGPGNLPSAPLPVPAFPAAAAPAVPAAPVRRRRMGPGELYDSIVDALPRLPESFIHSDVTRALGYAPDRASLHRTLLELIGNGHVAVLASGKGNRPTRYRRA
jgi:hypothetical protein